MNVTEENITTRILRNDIGIVTLKKKYVKTRRELDLSSTMSSPRTGVLSLIRFNSGQD